MNHITQNLDPWFGTCTAQISLFRYIDCIVCRRFDVANVYESAQEMSESPYKEGHYRPANEVLFERHFAGGQIVAQELIVGRDCMLTGLLLIG